MKNVLAENKIGVIGSTLMGIAGTAPVFSIEVTTSTLIAAMGLLAPTSIFYAGLIMIGIAMAFVNLNKVYPSAGTVYTWGTNVFGKFWGFMAGWALLVAVSIFMVSGTLPISNAFLLLFAPSLVNNVNYIAIISILSLSVISAVLLKGIKVSSYLQNIITIIETIILLALLISGIYKYIDHPFVVPHMSMLYPDNMTAQIFIAGSIIAIFFYWGWDVILNLSEETKGRNSTPGRSVYFAMAALIAIFMSFTILTMMALTTDDIAKYNTNILYALAENVWGSSYAYMAVIVVLLSTLGTIETGMIQFTRTLFAKSRDGILHARYSAIHSRWQTPWVATIIVWGIGVIMILASTYLQSVNNILQVSISAIGLMICFYLSIAGFACAYYYRRLLRDILTKGKFRTRLFLELITHVLYPLLSASFLIYIALCSFIDFDNLTRAIGLGGLLVGLIPYSIFYCKKSGKML